MFGDEEGEVNESGWGERGMHMLQQCVGGETMHREWETKCGREEMRCKKEIKVDA